MQKKPITSKKYKLHGKRIKLLRPEHAIFINNYVFFIHGSKSLSQIGDAIFPGPTTREWQFIMGNHHVLLDCVHVVWEYGRADVFASKMLPSGILRYCRS